MSSSENNNKTWRFLSNHTQVLLCLSRDPNARFRDIAQSVGITERAAQRIVADLIESGYVESERVGRRNHYQHQHRHRHAPPRPRRPRDRRTPTTPPVEERLKLRSGACRPLMPAVGDAARAVIRDAQEAGVWVFAGGVNPHDEVTVRVVAPDGGSPTARRARRTSAESRSSTWRHAKRRSSGLPRSPSPAAVPRMSASSCPTRPWATDRSLAWTIVLSPEPRRPLPVAFCGGSG